jgi:hypothetical protein
MSDWLIASGFLFIIVLPCILTMNAEFSKEEVDDWSAESTGLEVCPATARE